MDHGESQAIRHPENKAAYGRQGGTAEETGRIGHIRKAVKCGNGLATQFPLELDCARWGLDWFGRPDDFEVLSATSVLYM